MRLTSDKLVIATDAPEGWDFEGYPSTLRTSVLDVIVQAEFNPNPRSHKYRKVTWLMVSRAGPFESYNLSHYSDLATTLRAILRDIIEHDDDQVRIPVLEKRFRALLDWCEE